MDLVLIFGSGAVGKMTVGQELMKITDYRLFHNHMMIEPVLEIFGDFNVPVITGLRDLIFDEYLKTNQKGMIFTVMWNFDNPGDWEYVKGIADKFERSGGNVYFVELVADQKVRLERNKTENRLANKASKRNQEFSEGNIRWEDENWRLQSRDGEVPFDNYIKIDNTYIEAVDVAKQIKEYFAIDRAH